MSPHHQQLVGCEGHQGHMLEKVNISITTHDRLYSHLRQLMIEPLMKRFQRGNRVVNRLDKLAFANTGKERGQFIRYLCQPSPDVNQFLDRSVRKWFDRLTR